MSCDSGSCRTLEKVWGVVDENRLYRLTFSQSLAQMIAQNDSMFKVQRFEYRIGKTLELGETSPTGLYALMSKRGHFALRISLIKEISQIHAEDDSRYLAVAYARPCS